MVTTIKLIQHSSEKTTRTKFDGNPFEIFLDETCEGTDRTSVFNV